MKLAGMFFILFSAVSVGVRIAVGLKDRCRYLARFLGALQVFQNEIEFRYTPLPKAFLIMSRSAEGEAKGILEDVSLQMEQYRWITPRSAMEQALKKRPEDMVGTILLELSDKIGKYDIDAQIREIERAKEQTRQLLSIIEEERKIKSKTYKTLTLCAGLAAAILLI